MSLQRVFLLPLSLNYILSLQVGMKEIENNAKEIKFISIVEYFKNNNLTKFNYIRKCFTHISLFP